MAQIQIDPIAGALGAEISGVDLHQVPDDATIQAIRDAWLEYQVIFFRDQDITVDQHKAFALRFGDLHVHPVLQQMKDQGHPEVVVLESDRDRPFVADRWHSDVTFEECPPMGSVLRAVDVPDIGGDTLWASMYAAYEALSDPMQRLLSDLQALHDGGGFKAIANAEQRQDLESRQTAVHPVIRTHPESGRKVLFVNSSFTKGIVGMKSAESRALLRFLFDHIATPDFSCRFRWRKHSIAMWDNRCTQHRVMRDNLAAHRRMERLTLLGDKPY
jgi:taurine dioxygenase